MPGVDIAGLGQFGVFRRPTPYDPVKILGRIILLQIVYTILLSLLTWSMPVRGRIIREVFDPSAFLSPQAPLTMVLYASGSLLIALFMYVSIMLKPPLPSDIFKHIGDSFKAQLWPSLGSVWTMALPCMEFTCSYVSF